MFTKELTVKQIIEEEALRGVVEVDGPEANPRIMEYLATTTIRATDDITPWCSALMNWSVEKAGYTGTGSAASASWYNWGKTVKIPKRGDLIGFIREDGSGHIGVFIEEHSSYYEILGGNQDNRIKISKFLKEKQGQTRKWYFRRPKKVVNSKVVIGAVALGGNEVAPVVVETAVGMFTVKDLKDLANQVKDVKAQVGEIKDVVTAVPDKGFTDYVDQATPYLVLALCAFFIYDRVKKMQVFGI